MKRDKCPKCESIDVVRKQGKITCLNCDLSLAYRAWFRLHDKLNSLKKTEFCRASNEILSDEERMIVFDRKNELWSRIECYFYGLITPELISEIRIEIASYIEELELKNEIPVGLIVKDISVNPNNSEALIVQFGISQNCPRKNVELLLPFLGGSKSLI